MLISGVRFIQIHPNTGQHDNLDYKDIHFPGGEGVHVVTSGVFRNFSTVFLLITEYLSIMSQKKLLIV